MASNTGTTEVLVIGKLVNLYNDSVIQEYSWAFPAGNTRILAHAWTPEFVRCEFIVPKNAKVRGYILVLDDNGLLTVLSEEAR